VARSVELSKLYRTKETPMAIRFGVPEISGQQHGTEDIVIFSQILRHDGV
jgi:hypothetical protein